MVKKITTGLGLLAIYLANPVAILAEDNRAINLNPPVQFNIPTGVTISTVIGAVVTILLIAAAVIFLVYLVLGGIKWIMSEGDKAQVEAARNQITHAIFGLVIVFGAWIVISLVQGILGINILNLQLPNIQGMTQRGG